MTKNKALEKLTTLFTGLQELPVYDYNSENKEFTKWERKAWRYIKEVFPDSDSDHIADFQGIAFEYYPVAFFNDGSPVSLFVKAHNKGRQEALTLLESFIEEVNEWEVPTSGNGPPAVSLSKTKVFIVHGHDETAILEVARFIEKLNLESIILREQVSSSKTIIEKIEEYTSDVGFAIVLYTECDIGGKDMDSLRSRARQNVVFEHGFLMNKLGRSNVCPLVKGDVETPGDISGVVYMSMDNESWHLPLVKELEASGYVIDRNLL